MRPDPVPTETRQATVTILKNLTQTVGTQRPAHLVGVAGATLVELLTDWREAVESGRMPPAQIISALGHAAIRFDRHDDIAGPLAQAAGQIRALPGVGDRRR